MRINLKVLAVAAALVCSAAVQAEGVYVGGIFGVMDTDTGEDTGGDSPLNAGIRAGYTWNSGWGIEAEFTDSLVEGEFGLFGNYSVTSQALYATYRSSGDIYFKGRLGLLHEELNLDLAYLGEFSISGSDSGVSAGIGVGFKLTENLTVEAEYTLIEADVGYFSGSLAVRF